MKDYAFDLADFPDNQPMPTVWSDRVRGTMETALDSESAISLACHVSSAFTNATDWDGLIAALDERGFHLRFDEDRLVLVNELTGVSLCTCASLGHSRAVLTERLGKPTVQAETGRLVSRRQPE